MDPYAITIDTWNKVAAAYQDRFLDFEGYNDTYDRFCELVDQPHAHVLEIGCGPGNITRYLLSRRPDLNVQGIDVSPNMVRLARVNNPTARFAVLDARHVDRIHSRFDAGLCGFCLPYLARTDCAKLLKDAAALLYTNGIFYLSTMEGDYARSGYETGSNGQGRMYVYYYSEAELRQELTDSGFDILEVVRKHFPQKDGTTAVHLIFLARKRL